VKKKVISGYLPGMWHLPMFNNIQSWTI